MIEPLWTIEDLASYLKCSVENAERVAARPGFPAWRDISGRGKGERQMKRWVPEHVRDYYVMGKAA